MSEELFKETKSPTELVRVLDQYVLVKQVMKKKSGRIIRDGAKNEKDKFDFSFEIVDKGPKCERGFNIGESPIFGEHVQFSGVRVIEKSEHGVVALVVVHENEIIAIDLEPLKTES